jgi:sigma-B regulation protein RsbU (phosphoserine phosphatase)
VFLWIGDATGHGAPAALVTSAARSAATIIETMNVGPAEALTQLNKAIYDVTNGKVMMTFMLACYNLKTQDLTYSNASHEPPYLVHTKGKNQFTKRDITLLNENNNPRLGQVRDVCYTENKVTLGADDLILFYTDGLADVQNPGGEKLGERKFLRLFLDSVPGKSSGEIVITMRNSLEAYREKSSLLDDITFFVFSLRGHKIPSQELPSEKLA